MSAGFDREEYRREVEGLDLNREELLEALVREAELRWHAPGALRHAAEALIDFVDNAPGAPRGLAAYWKALDDIRDALGRKRLHGEHGPPCGCRACVDAGVE